VSYAFSTMICLLCLFINWLAFVGVFFLFEIEVLMAMKMSLLVI
jgi:hypothetical protein